MERVVGVVVDRGVLRGNGQSSVDKAGGNVLGQAGRDGEMVTAVRPQPEVLEHPIRWRCSRPRIVRGMGSTSLRLPWLNDSSIR